MENERIACGVCGGEAEYCEQSIKRIVGSNILVIHNVPCYVCNQCGEVMFTLDVAEKLDKIEATYRKIKENTETNYSVA